MPPSLGTRLKAAVASRDAILDLRAGERVHDLEKPAAIFCVVRADEDGAVCLLQGEDGSRRWQHLSSLRVRESFLGEAQCGPEPVHLARALGEVGFAVCDGFESSSECHAIREALLGLQMVAGTTVARNDIHSGRGDRVAFIEDETVTPVVRIFLERLDDIVMELQALTPSLKALSLVRNAMASRYPADGARYIRHIDNPDRNGRKLTCIVYFNEGWAPEHGGCLRLHLRGDAGGLHAGPVDVPPTLGRLVIFPSETRQHEVLPSYHERVALTCWYHDVEELQMHSPGLMA